MTEENIQPEAKTEFECPYCGSIEFEGKRMYKQLLDEGYLGPKSATTNTFQIQPLTQEEIMKKAVTAISGKFKIKMMVYTWDVCSKCRGFVCTKSEIVETDAQVQAAPPPMAQRPVFRNLPNQRGGLFPSR